MNEEPKTENPKERKTRKRRNFPMTPFQECWEFTKMIYDLGAGQKVRRLTVFEKLDKSPDSSASRMLITNCSKYNLLKGNYSSEYLEITDKGKQAVNTDLENQIEFKARYQLCFLDIEIYKFLYEKFSNNKLPSHAVVGDLLRESYSELEKEEADLVVDTFIVNLKYLGLLKTISGAERIITFEHALEGLPIVAKQQTQSITQQAF